MQLHLLRRFALSTTIALVSQATAQTLEVSSTGNVGIGTASPGTRALKVQSSNSTNDVGVEIALGRTVGTNYGLIVSATGSGASLNQGILTTARDGTTNFGLRVYDVLLGSSNYAIYSDSAAKSYFEGSVGIGTTAPITPLQVVGPITAGVSAGSTLGADYLYGLYGSGKLFTIGSLYSSAASFLGFSVKAKPGAVGFLSSTDVTVGRSAFEANSGYLAFWTGASQTSTDGGSVSITERMRIDASGNVGIGTTSPTYKLEVVGSIRATSFVANSNTYADFVFKPDYKLRSLSEVEASIKTHGHLPDIPSEAEANARGIDLAQMQVKLLQKVEEITLYLLVHEKEMKAQEQALQQLQAENHALRHLLSESEKR